MVKQHAKQAPSFSLPDHTGTMHYLDYIYAPYMVLYFYPEDSSKDCTIQSKEFSALLDKFHKLGTHVIGISGKDSKSKAMFSKTNNLKHLLLADEDFKVSKEYQSYKNNKIERKTFILNKNKEIIKTFESINPKGHAQEVLKYILKLENTNFS